MTLFTDNLRALIGAEVAYVAPEPLGRASLRYFARAVGDDNPVYTDDEAARAAGYAGVIAPPTLVVETNQYSDRPRGADGYIGHRWELPITGCREIRGGHHYVFGRPARPDDILHVRWRLEDIYVKQSRAGSEMLFVEAVQEVHDQHGELLATNRETTIYQPLGDTA